MSDLIDRQAAIDAIEQMQIPIMRSEFPEEQFVFTGMSEALQAIKELPSAQHEQHYDEWCTDCKEYDHERHCCPRWNKVIREALKDAQPEIIRCKDCKNYQTDWQPQSFDDGHYCAMVDTMMPYDGFCHMGERREDG